MKCSSCGTDIPSGNTCPSCGALNIPFNSPTTSTLSQAAAQQAAPAQPQVQQPVAQAPVQATPVAAQPQMQVTESQIVAQNATENIETLGIDETGAEEQVNITANMAAPSLAVNDENLTANVENISATDDATYDPNQTTEISTPENAKPESNVVTFDIPPVNKNTNTTGPTTGIQELTTGNTVGDAAQHELTPVKPKRGFTLKINLSNKSNLVYFGVIILAIVAGIIIGKTFFSKTIQSNNYGVTNQTKVQTVANGKNGETLVDGYKYKIPDSYLYDKTSNGLFVFDKNSTYRIYAKIYDGVYDDFANAVESIKATLTENGVGIVDSKELKVGEKSYLTFEAQTQMQNRLIGFTNAIDEKLVYVEIIASDNNFNYDALEVINDILVNAEKQDKVNELEKVNIYDSFGLINKTVEANKQITN